MNSKHITTDASFQPNKKSTCAAGNFCLSWGRYFCDSRWFSLGNIGTSILIVGLGFLAGFIFPKLTTERQGEDQEVFTKRIFPTIVRFVWLVLAAFVLSIVWLWLSQRTGISSRIFAAVTFALTGLGLIGWSYTPMSDK